MSNHGPTNSSGAKAFQKSGKTSMVEKVVPLGFLAAGAGSAAVAAVTAITPAPHSAIESAAKALDRMGFDKGPLLMFGVLMGGLGYTLLKLRSAGSGNGAADVAAEAAEGNASSLEMQGAILGSLQGEIGGLRHEFAESRREAAEAKANEEGNGEASDPLFRLAASLDQLGAQIDKRVDKARREMLDAVAALGGQVEVGAEQHEKSAAAHMGEVEAVRMDIADMRAQVVRVTEETSATMRAVQEVKAEMASGGGSREVAPAQVTSVEVASAEAVESAPPAPAAQSAQVDAPQAAEAASPSLPRELSDVSEPVEAEPRGPVPAQEQPMAQDSSDEPRFTGYSHDDEPAEEPAAAELGVNMKSLGFAPQEESEEPAAPLPKPSEDLGLIDEMNKDTARQGDITPPLFPDV